MTRLQANDTSEGSVGVLQAHFLGTPRLELDGEPVQLRYRKAYALLYLLLIDRSPWPRDELVSMLWPHLLPERGRNNLRVALSAIRSSLGEILDTRRDTVAIHPEANVDVDFGRIDAWCRNVPDAVRPDLGTTHERLLGTFRVNDSEQFDEWIEALRESFSRRVAEAWWRESDDARDAGDVASSLTFAREAVAAQPWNEVSHRRLMRSLVDAGRPAEALQQYETCRENLARYLDAAPSVATEQLADRIESEAVRRDTGRSKVMSPLPFVGREPEIRAVRTWLLDSMVRLITITGVPGVGKSRLIAEASARVRSRFSGGQTWVQLDLLTESDDPWAVVRKTFGIEGASLEEEALIGQIRARVGDDPHLLVLNDARDASSLMPTIESLLNAIPNLTILMTGETISYGAGHRGLTLQTLETPPIEASDEAVLECASARLFVSVLEATGLPFQPSDRFLADFGHLLRLLRGHPVSLILAAHKYGAWGDELLNQTLAHSERLFSGGPQFLRPRHRDVVSCVEPLAAQIEERDYALVLSLALVHSGVRTETLEYVIDKPQTQFNECLRRLIQKQVIERVPSLLGTSKFRLAPGLALALMADSRHTDTLDALRKRYAKWFSEQGEQAHLLMRTPDARRVVLGYLESELAINVAIRWAEEFDPPSAVRLASHLWRPAVYTGNLEFSLRRLDRLLAQFASQLSDRDRMEALMARGAMRLRRGQHRLAQEDFLEAIGLLESMEDPSRLAAALQNYAITQAFDGAFEQAHESLAQAQMLAERDGDSWQVGSILVNTGHLFAEEDRFHEAIDAYTRALRAFSGYSDPESRCSAHLGIVLSGSYLQDEQRVVSSVASLRNMVTEMDLPIDARNLKLTFDAAVDAIGIRGWTELAKTLEHVRDEFIELGTPYRKLEGFVE